jgi:hypothetical protein
VGEGVEHVDNARRKTLIYLCHLILFSRLFGIIVRRIASGFWYVIY